LHIRHRDNLAADLAMVVRCLCWFHPLVWWLDHRLMVERELARDEEAIGLTEPETYLRSLIKVCQSSLAAPPGFPAMSSHNINKRMELIVSNRTENSNPIFRAAGLVAAGLAAVLTSVVLVSVPVTAQDRPLTPYEKWLAEDVVYIVTAQERAAFERLRSDPEREHFIEQFWLIRDPTPGTAENEMKVEHYRRIAYANQRFGTQSSAGWSTQTRPRVRGLCDFEPRGSGGLHRVRYRRTGTLDSGEISLNAS
jgi:GWxTD domain-containing protein